MRFLVTGASGFLGNALCSHLIQQGEIVMGAVRKAGSLPMGVSEIIVSRIDRHTDWAEAISDIQVVVHLAAITNTTNRNERNQVNDVREVNVLGTERLARAAAESGVRRFVFVSSIGVNGSRTQIGNPFSETAEPAPIGEYAISKFEAERCLRKISEETAMEIVIVRPPLVYGPGAKGKFAVLMRAVLREWPLPFGAIQNKRSLVAVGNLVDFIGLCAKHPAAADQTFLISDGHDVSISELVVRLAIAARARTRLIPIPERILRLIGTVLGQGEVVQGLCGNLQIDIGKARALLGWSPPISLEHGLQSAVAPMAVE